VPGSVSCMRSKVHAIPAADEDDRQGECRDAGEHADAQAGFVAGFVEIDPEGEDELLGPGAGLGFDAAEVLGQVAQVGDDERPDEAGFALGEDGGDLPLGPDDLPQAESSLRRPATRGKSSSGDACSTPLSICSSSWRSSSRAGL
jgi:hypothetical protein